MITSEKTDQILAALTELQGMVENATKNSVNPQFKSKYANLSAVLDVIREPLLRCGLSISHFLDSHDNEDYFVTLLAHKSGQSMRSSLRLPKFAKVQELGSIITYFRRYSICAICQITQDDDDGETNRVETERRRISEKRLPPVPVIANPSDLEKIRLLAPEGSEFHARILNRFQIKRLDELEPESYGIVLETLQKLKK